MSRKIFTLQFCSRSLSVLLLSAIWLCNSSPYAAQRQQPSKDMQLVQEEIKTLPPKEKRWALIIGVDKYEDDGITPLRGAANDARALRDALRDFAGFDERQMILLTTDEPKERQPTRANILRRLSNLKGLVPKDGLLFVSFSGHGIERGGQAFLIGSDATFTQDIALLEDTAVSVERMKNLIKATAVKQVLMLVDACRNDPASGTAESANPLTEAFRRGFSFERRNDGINAFAVLYATSVGERAYEYLEKRLGYFSWAVVEAMSGKAADTTTGEVTLRSLVRYVEQTVPRQVAIDYGTGKRQFPFAVIEGYRADDLVLAIDKKAATAVKPVVPPVLVDASAGETAFWRQIENSTDAADFEEFLKDYPNGIYVASAKFKLKKLREPKPNNTAKIEPSPPPVVKDRKPKAGNVQTVNLPNGVTMDLVYVPAGEFDMGSEKGYENEMPARRIKITKDFEMMKTEVTQGQWEAVMKTTLRQQRDKWEARLKTLTQQELNKALSERNTKMVKRLEESKEHLDKMYQIRGEGSDYPMYFVSWDEARGFVQALNSLNDGYKYRLPTEAEWEYAARAGTTGDYAGSLDSMGWYCANSGNTVINGKDCSDKKLTALNSQSHPVGQKQPNAWNLYDMHGNVQEWTADWFGEYNPSDISDPMGAASGRSHVVRGGCWSCGSKVLRSAARNSSSPNNNTGFRVVRTAL